MVYTRYDEARRDRNVAVYLLLLAADKLRILLCVMCSSVSSSSSAVSPSNIVIVIKILDYSLQRVQGYVSDLVTCREKIIIKVRDYAIVIYLSENKYAQRKGEICSI